MLQFNVDLSRYNTLRLPARASCYCKVTHPSDVVDFCRRSRALPSGRRFVLGGGSNIVLTGDFQGAVLHMAITGRSLLSEDSDAWYVAAAGGEDWHDFVEWTLAQGWPGLENLALIPGTVGAAPIQNIGAYGLELSQRFHSLDAIDLDSGAQKTFDRAACNFAYRDSVFKQHGWHRSGRYAITRVVFRLPKSWSAITDYADVKKELDSRKIARPGARDIADAVIAVRRRKLPDLAQFPNVGSFFQNPIVDAETAHRLGVIYPKMPRYVQADGRVKLAAGWLIERAGWKGRRLGPVGMHESHALVLVNHEPELTRGTDIGLIAEAVRADVKRRFDVSLSPEPTFL